MRPGPPTQPSRRRPPRRQHKNQLYQHRRLRNQQPQFQPHYCSFQNDNTILNTIKPAKINNKSKALSVLLLLLVSGPFGLVLGIAESPIIPGVDKLTEMNGYDWSHSIFPWSQPKAAFNRIVQETPPLKKTQSLTIGYLTAIKGNLINRQGLAISGAIAMALDEVSFRHFFQKIIIIREKESIFRFYTAGFGKQNGTRATNNAFDLFKKIFLYFHCTKTSLHDNCSARSYVIERE